MSNPEILPSEGFGPEAFAQALGVSRETLALLEAYAGLLAASPHNLVSQASLAEVWHRHFYDSAQLDALIPSGAKTLVDLGSGAGFPGLVLAILRRGQIKVTLFEATGKKAAFLKEVAAALGLDIVLRQQRIEDVPKQRFDVVTARAFAPLPQLLSYAQKFTGPNSICLFLKGQNHATELTQARQVWKMDLRKHPSKTHPLGVILEIRNLRYAAR
jgi:16S rRNA (guanine527-N7)-methyltransferase